jgi:hypothetical protein
MADDAYVPPRYFFFDEGVNDDVAFVRWNWTAVEQASPLHFNSTFDVVKNVVLIKQLGSSYTLAKNETSPKQQIATSVLDTLPLEARALPSNVLPARM